MKLAGVPVVVTGAGGFIASHLVEALVRAGARVRALVHYNSRGNLGHLNFIDPEVLASLDVVFGDVRDRSAVRELIDGCELVFHLAALIGIPYSYRAPQSYVETNITGTLNVLEGCRQCGVRRLVHTSTSEVYGTAQYTPIDEAHPLHAQSPYAATKLAADQLAYSYFASFDMPIVTVRPFNTYGPRQSARAVIPTIIVQALAGSDIRLGSTSPVRDFLFVEDTARGFLAAAGGENVCGEVVNLGTGTGVTIGQVVEAVQEQLGRPLTVHTDQVRARPGRSEVLELICAAEKAQRLLEWRPEIELGQGLAKTIDWLQDHRHEYSSDRYAI
jgi:NAD dependent epimerase/dehydratase